MNVNPLRRRLRFASALLFAAALGGCNLFTRISEVGDGPEITGIVNPTGRPGYQPVSMPMPAPTRIDDNPNSLWRAGARAFFKDVRAKEVGDILTVKLALADSAKLSNKTERERDDSEDTNVTNLLGLELEYAKVLPQGITAASVFSFDNDHETKGDGEIDRSETVTVTFAAIVSQILPNGALSP